jgi:2,3-bisphosphoglycerate-dependent phosphoglycerate mutase
MSETTVWIVRHGETEWNRLGRWQGQQNTELSELGRSQAVATGKRLREERFSAIYASDLRRAQETAECTAQHHGLAVACDPRLRERGFGVLEGLTHPEMAEKFPREHEMLEGRDVDWAPPGGESLSQRHARAVQAFEQIAAAHRGESIILFTHGGVVDTLLRHVLDISLSAPRRFFFPNCALNRFILEGDRWWLALFGDTAHLPASSTPLTR